MSRSDRGRESCGPGAPRVRGLGLAGLAGLWLAAASAQAAPERAVHRFLEVALAPSGAFVATVEGDAPRTGRAPAVRDLVIRRADRSGTVIVALPCGRVAECWPSSPAWSRDSASLTFALRTPGSHARALYRVDPDGSHLAQVLSFDGTITSLRFGPDGRLAMLATPGAVKEVGATQAGAAVTGELGADPREQRIAILDHAQLAWASPADLYVYEYDWLPDGHGFVGTAAAGDGDSHWWVAALYGFDAATGTARLIYRPSSAQQQLAVPRAAPDGRSVAFIAGLMSDFGRTGGDVYRVPLAGGPAANAMPALRASATALEFDCSGRLLVALLAGEESQLVELGADGVRTVRWHGTDSLTAGDADVALGCPSPLTATVRESFTAPPELQLGPLGGWQPLTSVNAGLTMPARALSIHWTSDGFEVQGWLLTPEASGPRPMITVVHGGPAAAATPAFAGPGITRELLSRGYALFYPNPRGSFGQGEAFTTANVRDFGRGDLRDILRGIDAAGRAAPIDATRLGLMGGSYGGFMTMWAVTQTQRFRAAVAGAGISNWLSYYGQNGIDAWLLPYFGASPYADPAVYARASPINFIRNVRTPTFTYVGENDIECPAPQTQEFWHALRELAVPTSSVIYPHEGHGLRDPEHLADLEQRVLGWFDRYLTR